tara:strand:+ start:1064 stop:1324 length:261 start_codon:yes stop_codon:yes gene_type:complete
MTKNGYYSVKSCDIMNININVNCGKESFTNKKIAKKSAKYLSRTSFSGFSTKYSIYHCKECNGWHIYTLNKNKIHHNKQHSRGGRR